MKHPLSRLLASAGLVIVIAGSTTRAADNDWKQVANDDGVTAWTQETAGGLPIARASTTVGAELCEVLAVIRNIERHCEWMADCVATRVLQRQDWQHVNMYLRMKGDPWVGVADRDAVLQAVTVVERPGSIVEVRFSAAAIDTGVLADDTVHMPRLSGAYRLTRVTDDTTEVDYRFHADLGGWVPGWVATRAVEQLPSRTLVNLRKHVAEARGTYRAEIDGWPQVDGGPVCGSAAAAKP